MATAHKGMGFQIQVWEYWVRGRKFTAPVQEPVWGWSKSWCLFRVYTLDIWGRPKLGTPNTRALTTCHRAMSINKVHPTQAPTSMCYLTSKLGLGFRI